MNPETTFNTDETPIYAVGIGAFFLLIVIIWLLASGVYAAAGFFVFFLIGAVRFVVTSYQDYREVKLYRDYLTIGGKSGEVRTIPYRDIISAGFLHSARFRSRTDGSKFKTEQLILLLRDNVKIELPQALEGTHELCAIIQSRIS